MLVCTTIVETGLDISNANTLIVERADSARPLASCTSCAAGSAAAASGPTAYFLYPPEKPLTETAHDRLQTIASHTDLGAGMQVAMKDLEIRGAGNLLGGEQSGHIAGRRLRPLRAAGRRGGRRLPRRRRRRRPPRSRSSCRSTPTCRTTTCRASGCASRRTRSSPPSSDEAGSPRSRPSCATATARRPSRCATCSRWPGCAPCARGAGIGDISVQGNHVRFGPLELRESQQLRLQRLYPGSLVKDALGTILVPKPMTARVGGQPLRDTAVLAWASDLIQAVLLDQMADAARVRRTRKGTAVKALRTARPSVRTAGPAALLLGAAVLLDRLRRRSGPAPRPSSTAGSSPTTTRSRWPSRSAPCRACSRSSPRPTPWSSLILAPFVIDQAAKDGKGDLGVDQARAAVKEINEPERRPRCEFVRDQHWPPDAAERRRPARPSWPRSRKAKITVNPRYGTLDRKQLHAHGAGAQLDDAGIALGHRHPAVPPAPGAPQQQWPRG